MRVFFSILLMALGCLVSSSAMAAPERLAPTRAGYYYGLAYSLYVPTVQPVAPLPLIVALHGCKQNGDSFIASSRLESKAREEKFALLTISQNTAYNFDHCWNWFMPVNQAIQSSLGEASAIKYLIMSLTAQPQQFDASRFYVIGMSAGAAMAANLVVCNPQLFKGAALHSGVAYHANSSVFDVERVIVDGSSYTSRELVDYAYNCAKPTAKNLRTEKVVFVHGDQDKRVTMKMSEDLFVQFSGYFEKAFAPQNLNFVLSENDVRVPGKYPYRMTQLMSPSTPIALRKYIVNGLAHNWSGGDENFSHADPRGPDVTTEILQFWGL